MLLAPIGNPEPRDFTPLDTSNIFLENGTQTVKMQFATGVKKNKRKHLRQNREGANLPFGAGVQYNRLYLQPLQSVVTG